jgi:hypothetical protein
MRHNLHIPFRQDMQAIILLVFLDKETLVPDSAGRHDTCQQFALRIAEFIAQGRCFDGSLADSHIGACSIAHDGIPHR